MKHDADLPFMAIFHTCKFCYLCQDQARLLLTQQQLLRSINVAGYLIKQIFGSAGYALVALLHAALMLYQ